ncbi:unnamed protein product [Phaeothamnion confervicola]
MLHLPGGPPALPSSMRFTMHRIVFLLILAILLAWEATPILSPGYCRAATRTRQRTAILTRHAASGNSGDSQSESTGAVRDALERLFESDASSKDSPFPRDSIAGAQEAAASVREALLNGKRSMIVDVEVAEFDDQGRGFDPESLTRFVGCLAGGLSLAGRVKVLMRTPEAATAASDQMQLQALTRGAQGIAGLASVAFSSFHAADGAPVGVDARRNAADDAAAATATASAAAAAAATAAPSDAEDAADADDADADNLPETAGVAEDDAVLVMVGPRGAGDMTALRAVIAAAAGRPVLVFNPRMRQRPLELRAFETVYDLHPYVVVPARRNPRARQNPLSVDRSATQIYSEAQAAFLPRVVLYRRFPAAWRLVVDADGAGYQEAATFERPPTAGGVVRAAQRVIDRAQRAARAAARELRDPPGERGLLQRRRRAGEHHDDDTGDGGV